MHNDTRNMIENLLMQLTNMEESKIKVAVNAVLTGDWAIPNAINDEEKELVKNLIKQLTSVDANVIKSMLKPGNSIDLGFSIINPQFHLPDASAMDKRKLTRAMVLLCSYIFYDEFHYPQPQVGEYNIGDNKFEKLKWLYRYWFNQLEVAEKGSNLEHYFREQHFDFELEDFLVESKVSLSSGGDLLAVDVLTPENTPYLFDGIQDFYSSADLVCANLESPVDSSKPIGRTQEKGQPARMNTSEEMFQKFREQGGINYFSTANNHSFDWGEEAVLATLDVLNQSGANHSGTNVDSKQQDDVLIIEKNGIKIAMLSYTFDLNGHKMPNGKTYLVNEVRFNDEFCDLSMVKKHVAKARKKKADIIIACCHWGWEFEMYPHNNICKVAKEICNLGVDVILGNHPHVSQPMETIHSTDGSKNLIVYSHGDFVSYHPESRNSKIAYVIKFDIVKGKLRSNGETQTHITNVKMQPIYILNKQLSDEKYDCRILQFNDVFESPEKYGLTELEKTQLPHLKDVVLQQILLPKETNGLISQFKVNN